MSQQNLTVLDDVDDSILVKNDAYKHQSIYDDLIERLSDFLDDDNFRIRNIVEYANANNKRYTVQDIWELIALVKKIIEEFGDTSDFSFIDDSLILDNSEYEKRDGEVNYPLPERILIKTDVDQIPEAIQRDLIAIVQKAEQESKFLIGKLNDSMPCWMSYLLQNIPIYNVSKDDFEKVTKIFGCCEEPFDALGYYRGHDFVSFLPNQDNPKIVICYEKIKEEAGILNIDSSHLCIFVLLHELAHAMMDPSNDFKGGKFEKYSKDVIKNMSKDDKKDDKKDEESYANMVMLEYLFLGKIEWLYEAVKFVESQPPKYKEGIAMVFGNNTWTDWRK